MRKANSLPLMMVLAVISALMLEGCQGKNNSPVTTFEINQSIKSIQTAYIATGKDAVFADSLPIYSGVDLCITWPEKLGHKSIKVLQDSLLVAIFGTTEKPIDAAMVACSKKPLGQDSFKMERIDSIPSDPSMVYTNNIEVSLRELSRTLLVYDITSYTFEGGAHGMTMTTFLNYDIENEQVLSFHNIFKYGSEEELMSAIRQQLYSEYNVENDKQLEDAGIFVDQLYVTHNYFIEDCNIVFYYNQYEIAPYAFGSVSIEIPYYNIESCLTPEAKALFKFQ